MKKISLYFLFNVLMMNFLFSQNNSPEIQLQLYQHNDFIHTQYPTQILKNKNKTFILPKESTTEYTGIIKYIVFNNMDTIFMYNTYVNDSLQLGIIDYNRNKDFTDDYHYYYNNRKILKNYVYPSFPIKFHTVKDSKYYYFIPVFNKRNLVIGGVDSLLNNRHFMLLGVTDHLTGTFELNGQKYFVLLKPNEIGVNDPDYSYILFPVEDENVNRDSVFKYSNLRKLKNTTIVNNLVFSIHNPDKYLQLKISYKRLEDLKKEDNIGVYTHNYTPDFTANDINNNLFNMQNMKGKYVLLDFWGTWCAPCIALLPHLSALHKKYPTLQFISIAKEYNEQGVKKVPEIINKYNMDWINIIESPEKSYNVGSLFKINSYPTIILIDPEGKILHRGGSDEIPQLNDLLKKELEGN